MRFRVARTVHVRPLRPLIIPRANPSGTLMRNRKTGSENLEKPRMKITGEEMEGKSLRSNRVRGRNDPFGVFRAGEGGQPIWRPDRIGSCDIEWKT